MGVTDTGQRMSGSLRDRTVRAIVWSAGERFGAQAINFLVTVLLARLLTPQDFGLIGMLMGFILMAEALAIRGVSQALVQRKDLQPDDVTSGLAMSVFFGVVLYAAVFLGSPAIADFFAQPQLVGLTRAAGGIILFDALNNVRISQLSRRLDFRALMRIGLISAASSGAIGVGFALAGFGVWSLVARMIAQRAIGTILLSGKSVPVFHGRIRKQSLRALFSYSWKLQLSGVFSALFDNLHALIIGRVFAVDIVGYYTKAKNLKNLPVASLSAVVGRVTFPAFSSIQDDLHRLKRGCRRSITMLVLVAFPLMIGMLTTADRLIPALLGSQWLPSVPFLQILSVTGLIFVMNHTLIPIPKALGRTDITLKLSIAKKIVALAVIFVTIRWGPYGLVAGQVVSYAIGFGLTAHVAGRLIGYTLRELIRDTVPYLGLASIMGAVVLAVGILFPGAPDGLVLAVQVAVGTLVYLALCHVTGVGAWKDLMALRGVRLAGDSSAS